MKILGIDTGGTFTDLVYYDHGRVSVLKVLSTPDAPEQAIFDGIMQMGVKLGSDVDIVHGSTVVTNAVLEHKGVRTAYIGNGGFADLLSIGRQARKSLYQLQPTVCQPPVPAELCFEADCRVAANGEIITPLSAATIDKLVRMIMDSKPRAVAINLLFSYIDGSHEKQIADRLPNSIFISCSSELLAESREFERGIVTWLNAWIGPIANAYLQKLQSKILPAGLTVMQSSGGAISVEQLGKKPVNLLLSGPAGGLVGAQYTAANSHKTRLLTLDMGGTSTDVALIDKDIKLTSEGKIGDYPVAMPMVDMHTIGAGGGSIASVDQGGLLHVGPESAGATPGPACYGNGSGLATVTDANLISGRLLAEYFLGGRMMLDHDAATSAIRLVAEKLDASIEEAAEGIISIANEHMVAALREISVQRGIDPRPFTLVSFGGAGGLHVCALADALDMQSILVPVHAGVLSALGMLVSPRSRQLSRSVNVDLDGLTLPGIETVFDQLIKTGKQEMLADGVKEMEMSIHKSADLRYQGQSYFINLDWRELSGLEIAFHNAHQQRYGHRLERKVELATIRVSLVSAAATKNLLAENLKLSPKKHNRVSDSDKTKTANGVPVYQRQSIKVGDFINGPALIIEEVATIWIERAWQCRLDVAGNLLIKRVISKN